MLYFEPFDAVDSVPNVHAHLSPFSSCCASYHAETSGSVTVSSSSCATIDAIASAPALPFGDFVCGAHDDRQRSALPTNEYLSFEPAIEPKKCQPQYCEQKPELSSTSLLVSTK